MISVWKKCLLYGTSPRYYPLDNESSSGIRFLCGHVLLRYNLTLGQLFGNGWVLQIAQSPSCLVFDCYQELQYVYLSIFYQFDGPPGRFSLCILPDIHCVSSGILSIQAPPSPCRICILDNQQWLNPTIFCFLATAAELSLMTWVWAPAMIQP